MSDVVNSTGGSTRFRLINVFFFIRVVNTFKLIKLNGGSE